MSIMPKLQPQDRLDVLTIDRPVPKPHSNVPVQRAKPEPSRSSGTAEDEYFVLVPDDQLHCRVVPPTYGPRSRAAAPDGCSAQIKLAARNFRNAFAEVWNRIARPEQLRMLSHWSRPPLMQYSHDQPLPRYFPAIQLGQDAATDHEPAECINLGCELRFEYALALDQPDQLPGLIARMLAHAYLFASRQQWWLLKSQYDDPLAEWISCHKRVTGVYRDRQEEKLERAFLAALEAEINVVLARWGWRRVGECVVRTLRDDDSKADAPDQAAAEEPHEAANSANQRHHRRDRQHRRSG